MDRGTSRVEGTVRSRSGTGPMSRVYPDQPLHCAMGGTLLPLVGTTSEGKRPQMMCVAMPCVLIQPWFMSVSPCSTYPVQP